MSQWQYRTEPLTARWEYQTVPLSGQTGDNLRGLNEAGAAGWELCHVAHNYYLMKRLVFRQQTTDAGERSGRLPDAPSTLTGATDG